MESEQLFGSSAPYRNSYNSITSASSDEELLDGAGVVMDFHTTEDDNLLDGDASPGRIPGWTGRSCGELPSTPSPPPSPRPPRRLAPSADAGGVSLPVSGFPEVIRFHAFSTATLGPAPAAHFLLCVSAAP
ncbi:hypothetical protein COCON_G00114790 [Conger conger]|uniref:Uncharacterized protein n=1 Tax=Conger conger TaxID=82655 RepID=A0A9Q1HY66_CONCO|nr:hypothetical protein COCON_G00114790 [Conger conger]